MTNRICTLLLLLGLALPLIGMSSTEAKAQEQTAKQFANNTSSQCFLPFECVKVEYESPNTVVLQGDYLVANKTLDDYIVNVHIWKVVDYLKTKGFVIDSIVLGGVGSQGNPNVYHIIMSKK